MTFAHSKNSRVFMNERHASGQVTAWTVTHTRQYGTATTILDSGAKFIPGLKSGALVIRGLFDSAQHVDTEVSTALGVDNGLLVSVCPDTTVVGARALFCPADPEGYEVAATVAESVTFAVDTVPDAMVDMGVVLHDHAAETADGNEESVDRGASSAGGAAASLHLTSYTGLTGITVKIQHSSDDDTYADLITFTAATGVTSEFKTVTGTVNRYVRASWDVTGTGSATFLVCLGPR